MSHDIRDGRCVDCGCLSDWPLARMACSFSGATRRAEEAAAQRAARPKRRFTAQEIQERRAKARLAQQARRAQQDPEFVRERNREYQRRHRERENGGEP